MDSNTKSFKAVLLHNENIYPLLPMAHSVHFKEKYNDIKIVLEALNYQKYNWEVIGDFKIIAILTGLQGGFTKFPCFLCIWDRRNTKVHYNKKKA